MNNIYNKNEQKQMYLPFSNDSYSKNNLSCYIVDKFGWQFTLYTVPLLYFNLKFAAVAMYEWQFFWLNLK